MKNRKQQFPLLFYILVLSLLITWGMRAFGSQGNDLNYSDIVALFEKEQVKSFVVNQNTIKLELHTPLDGKTELTERLADPESFRAEMTDLIREQNLAEQIFVTDFYFPK